MIKGGSLKASSFFDHTNFLFTRRFVPCLLCAEQTAFLFPVNCRCQAAWQAVEALIGSKEHSEIERFGLWRLPKNVPALAAGPERVRFVSPYSNRVSKNRLSVPAARDSFSSRSFSPHLACAVQSLRPSAVWLKRSAASFRPERCCSPARNVSFPAEKEESSVTSSPPS